MSDVSKSLQEHRKSAYKFTGDLFDTLGLDVKKEEPVKDSEDEVIDELSMDIPETNEGTVSEVVPDTEPVSDDTENTVSEEIVSTEDSQEDTSSPFDDVEGESTVIEVSSVEELVSPGDVETRVSETVSQESVTPVESTTEPLSSQERQLQEAILARTQAIAVDDVEMKTEGTAKTVIDGLLLDAVYQRLQIDVKLDARNRMIRDVGAQYVMAYILAEWLGWDLQSLPEKLGWNESTISTQWAPLIKNLKEKQVVTANPIIDYIRSLETKMSHMDHEIRRISETNELALIGYAHDVGSRDSVARTPKERMDTGLKRLDNYRRAYYRKSTRHWK